MPFGSLLRHYELWCVSSAQFDRKVLWCCGTSSCHCMILLFIVQLKFKYHFVYQGDKLSELLLLGRSSYTRIRTAFYFCVEQSDLKSYRIQLEKLIAALLPSFRVFLDSSLIVSEMEDSSPIIIALSTIIGMWGKLYRRRGKNFWLNWILT